MSRTGLHFPSNLDYESWERAGVQLSRIIDSSAWCLGDWLVCGQDNYADRYERAIEVAGLDYKTLRNYAWVSRQFPMSRRRDRLSFQHHAEVASLTTVEQDEWLDRAARAGWSRNELRRQLRNMRCGRPVSETPTAQMPRLSVPRERVDRWRAAAQSTNDRFENWIVVMLDRAAKEVLDAEASSRGDDLP